MFNRLRIMLFGALVFVLFWFLPGKAYAFDREPPQVRTGVLCPFLEADGKLPATLLDRGFDVERLHAIFCHEAGVVVVLDMYMEGAVLSRLPLTKGVYYIAYIFATPSGIELAHLNTVKGKYLDQTVIVRESAERLFNVYELEIPEQDEYQESYLVFLVSRTVVGPGGIVIVKDSD